MFLYINKEAYQRPEVRAFIDFYLANAERIVEHPRVNYVAFPQRVYEMAKKRLASGKTGSAMAKAGGEKNIMEIFKKH